MSGSPASVAKRAAFRSSPFPRAATLMLSPHAVKTKWLRVARVMRRLPADWCRFHTQAFAASGPKPAFRPDRFRVAATRFALRSGPLFVHAAFNGIGAALKCTHH